MQMQTNLNMLFLKRHFFRSTLRRQEKIAIISEGNQYVAR